MITQEDVADLYENDGIFETNFDYSGKFFPVELEYDDSAKSIHGIVKLYKDVVDFYGKNLEELKIEFKLSMDEYYDMVKK